MAAAPVSSRDERYQGAKRSSRDAPRAPAAGEDTVTWSSGNVYVGRVDKGRQPHGVGTKYFADGSKYHGEFKHGRMHGHGTHWNADGRLYRKSSWKTSACMCPRSGKPCGPANSKLAFVSV